ncbi:hypothetical protein FKM82_006497 [Ascaphus truei]
MNNRDCSCFIPLPDSAVHQGEYRRVFLQGLHPVLLEPAGNGGAAPSEEVRKNPKACPVHSHYHHRTLGIL